VNVGAGLTNTISANLLDGGGNGGLTKTGAGTLTLSGNNTYSGNTTVSGGTLSIGNNSSSTFAGSSTITISSGAQLNLPNAATNIVRTLILGPQTYTSGTFNSSNFESFITGSGTIQVGAAVEPSYSDWASENALTGTSADDYDGDGVSNGLEYVLGGDRYTNDSGKMPEVTVTEGNMIFTFVRSQASINAKTDVDILVGTDLVAWPTVYTVGTDTAGSTSGVTITKGLPVAGKDTVSLTVTMSSDPKKFARLRVITK
jgi:autotransporter-associated beta strand protein